LGDLKSFQERYLALRQSMVDDGLRTGVPFHANDLRCLVERLSAEGTSFVKVTLPQLGKALDQGLVSGRFSCIAHFRLKRETCLPLFCYAVFNRIFEDDGILRRDPCIHSIRYLRLFLLLDSKLVYEPTPVMKNKAVDEFRSRMASLRKVVIPKNDSVLLRAKYLLGSVLSTLDLTEIVPGQGPGAVAERIDRFGRWDFTTWPVKAERYYPYIMYGTHSIRALLERGKGIRMDSKTHTRCCLVPKDFKGPRLISAEHTVNQYLQQGQMKKIMQFVARHSLLSKSIKLRDQTFNQKLASRAYDQGLATLDLSNASDTVSVALVWYLLSDVPKLRAQLMSTRSDYMIYSGSKIRIAAFSPMGSATCFPVETLVFWALSLASMQQVFSNTGDKYSCSLNVLSDRLAVFGDDIIIPEIALPTLIHTLRLVGCEPNMSKTCYLTPFRESCGSEWFGNHDVTIIRNKRFSYSDVSVKDHPVLLDLQRKFFVKELFKTASLIESWAREIYPTARVAFSTFLAEKQYAESGWTLPGDSPGMKKRAVARILHDFDYFQLGSLSLDKYCCTLGMDTSIPRGLPIRYNQNYQRYECRAPIVHQDSKSWLTGGYPRLLARLLGDQSDRIAIRDRKIKMAWSYLPIFLDFHLE
jgi:hypothetical protein